MHMLAQLNAYSRVLALAGLRSQYPHDSEEDLRRRIADQLLGKELARKVYGESRDENEPKISTSSPIKV